jgi:hypothetical protein
LADVVDFGDKSTPLPRQRHECSDRSLFFRKGLDATVVGSDLGVGHITIEIVVPVLYFFEFL